MLFNILQFICATYVHNYEVIGFFVAMLAALYALIKKPTRQRVLFFVGFLLLILHFEYYKHISEGLQDQTLATLFLEEPHYRGRWLTRVFIQHVIPFSLWLAAWGSITLALIKPKWLFVSGKEALKSTAKGKKV